MMMKKRLFYLSQLLWQVLFFLTNTVWKDIPKIPIWASQNDILDKMRWLWLMDAPSNHPRCVLRYFPKIEI